LIQVLCTGICRRFWEKGSLLLSKKIKNLNLTMTRNQFKAREEWNESLSGTLRSKSALTTHFPDTAIKRIQVSSWGSGLLQEGSGH
jgi:hypothetical protein